MRRDQLRMDKQHFQPYVAGVLRRREGALEGAEDGNAESSYSKKDSV